MNPAPQPPADPPRAERLCPVCLGRAVDFAPGPAGRPDASCPYCRSLERQRLLAALLYGAADRVAGCSVLDVAPSPQVSRVLSGLAPARRVGLDFDPGADGRAVDVQGSLTHLPFPARNFDLIVCFHVLEHIPDDAAAMREMGRVLTPRGLALVQVPWRRGTVTDEDPSAPVSERIERFGQADHVRYYGDDFEDRLRDAGLEVLRVTPDEVLGPDLARLVHVPQDQVVWLVRGAADGPRPSLTAEVELLAIGAAGYVRGVLAGLGAARPEELAEARREAIHWERAYRTLRGRLPVRVMAKLSGH